jgi:hypothetical protein
MRILFTIAHYYKPKEGFYGSQRADPRPRIDALTRSIASLHANFGRRQGLLDPPRRQLTETNAQWRDEVEVVVCTTRDAHLVDTLPADLFRHHATAAEPMLLGYECHAVMKEALGRFDYYCYLEDDILVEDPWFFRKLAWFTGEAGDRALLQPNRFEIASGDKVQKLYIDCNLLKPELSEKYQNVNLRPTIQKRVLNEKIMLQRVNNPHAGCFFLNAKQMAKWAQQPYFLDRATDFGGPLESAATLGVMRCFECYKPARENAAFLEVEHMHPRYMGRYLEFAPEAPFKFRVLNPNG